MSDVSKRQKFFYGFLAPVYNFVQRIFGYNSALADFVKTFSIPEDSYILDAGCGPGIVAFALAPSLRYGKVVGFDRSRSMIKKANRTKLIRQQHNTEFFLGDVTCVNPLISLEGRVVTLDEESFDFVFASGVLEHVEVYPGIKELARYLKPDGVLVDIGVREATPGRLISRPLDFKIHTKESVLEAFIEAGFLKPKEVPIEDQRLRRFRVAITGKKTAHKVPSATKNSVNKNAK